MNNNKR